MSVILSLDVATLTGHALIDTETTYSQIRLGKFKLSGEVWEKAAQLRNELREIRRRNNRIDYAVIEMPLTVSPQYQKKSKEDLASGVDQQNREDASVFMKRLQSAIDKGGLAGYDVANIIGEYFSSPTINSTTTTQLNWLVGAAQATLQGMGIEVEIVRAQSWQAIIPKEIRDAIRKPNGKRDTKGAVRVYCDRLQIVGGNEDSRDAAIMGIWCQLRSTQFKAFQNQGALV